MHAIPIELIALIGFAYVCSLFYIAYQGDKNRNRIFLKNKAVVYSLSLAVYCSSWTFFGAVGTATRVGWDFFAIYLGPIILFLFGHRLLSRIIIISKQQNITSVSDFISSRFGKSRHVAIVVTSIAAIGSLPYISLQLQAISMSFHALTNPSIELNLSTASTLSDTAFYGAILLAIFSILFGTRHLSATEHHRGMIHAIAFESIVKLVAILFVAFFAGSLLLTNMDLSQISQIPFALISRPENASNIDFMVKLVLSMGAIILLPRQFQVTVVETDSEKSMTTARWLLPLYLLIISLVAVPISMAGVSLLAPSAHPDLFVLNLPLQAQSYALSTFAFIGGLSAATGMVIVGSISLSTMICNDIVMPMLIRIKHLELLTHPKLTQIILRIRRATIMILMIASYGFYRLSSNNQDLANMGLLSFAAIIQLAPAMVAALFWQRANQRGVVIGLVIGFTIWVYCLLMPNFVGEQTLNQLFGANSWIHPQHLFNLGNLSPLSHGVIWSLVFNSAAMILASLKFKPSFLDKIQASLFMRQTPQALGLIHRDVTHQLATIASAKELTDSILGTPKALALFETIEQKRGHALNDTMRLDRDIIEDIEKSIASVIGASSASHVITTQLLGENVSAEDLFLMMDETSQALQFNQEILSASFENIRQGISVVDKDLKLVAWNSRFKNLFNCPKSLLQVGTPIEQLFEHIDANLGTDTLDMHRLIDEQLQCYQTGASHTSEAWYSDDTCIQVEGNAIPSGGYVTSYTDITEQKRVEQALRESEQKIRLYTNNLPLMLSFVSSNGEVAFSNKAYDAFLSVNAGVESAQSISDLFDSTSRNLIDDNANKALLGKAVQFSATLQSKQSNENEHYQINFIPHATVRGAVEGYFSIYQNITHNVLAENLLKQTNEDLEERVQERTQDLEELNQRLLVENTTSRELSEQLKRVTKSKTRFLAAASHDLLQPINAARLFTHSMIDNPQGQDPKQQAMLNKIDSSLVSADQLLRALLDISKLDTGTLTPEITRFNIGELLAELNNELTPVAQNKGIQLRFVKTTVTVQSDRALLRSVLQNLISNAIRYTRKGAVLVGGRRKGAEFQLQVIDTGIGIKPQDLDDIFNEFHRLNPSATDLKEQGLGLGLAITKRVSQILNHEITVDSKFGKGSVFSVSVPCVSGVVIDLPVKNAWVPTNKLQGLRVLYLENSPQVLQATSALLSSWNCQTVCCASYDEALEAYNNDTIDIVMADYRLDEERSGLEFLIQLDGEGSQISGILVTAEQDTAIKSAAHNAGFFFLPKPVDPAALKNILIRLGNVPNKRASSQEAAHPRPFLIN